jgi:cytochrome c oxidase cbb3-type subunit 1
MNAFRAAMPGHAFAAPGRGEVAEGEGGLPEEMPALGRAVAVHTLGWMFAANLVGVWLAILLLWPEAGDALAPLTYGRWAPLHLNWQLYGACALPLVGALLAWCLDPRHPQVGRHAHGALAAWSLALALGGVAWLGGTTSGKLFLDWHGWTRPLLPAAMHVIWALLAAHTWWRWPRLAAGGRAARGAVLAGLLIVPTVFFWSAGREFYPAVNPDSGGATGAALLGSTLGIVMIYLALPALLGLGWREGTLSPAGPGARRKWARRAGVALAGSWLVFAIIDRGHASHHAPAQIAALAVLGLWILLLPAAWGERAWPEAAGPWRRAAAGWWALLVVSGWVSFLPGVSEALKFTHGLVAHAHLAMAGFVISVNGAVLAGLTGRAAPRGVFALWQGGCVVMVAAMLVLGVREAGQTAEVFRGETWVQALLGLRLAAGLAMLAASARWLAGRGRA